MLQTPELRVLEVKDYSVVSKLAGFDRRPLLLVRIRDMEIHATGLGGRRPNASMIALKSIEKQLGFQPRHRSTTK